MIIFIVKTPSLSLTFYHPQLLIDFCGECVQILYLAEATTLAKVSRPTQKIRKGLCVLLNVIRASAGENEVDKKKHVTQVVSNVSFFEQRQ